MNLPEDTHLAYTVWHEAWYADASRIPGELPHLMVSASAKGSGGGVAWEFQVDEEELGREMVTRVKMFDDAYPALTQMPEFFAALAEQQPATLAEVRAILNGLGAVDETERVSPYGNKPAGPDAALDEIAAAIISDAGAVERLTQIDTVLRRTGRNRAAR
jgi:hypothetical protein